MFDINDKVDAIIYELKQIKQAMGVEDKDIQQNVYAGQRKKLLPRNYVVAESSDLDQSNEDGTITLEAGETKTLAEISVGRGESINLFSVGASDDQDVRYALVVDDDIVSGSQTESPLGLINDEFSFPKEFDSAMPVDNKVEYVATYSADATGSVDLAARMHGEVLPNGDR